jgi:hypothetical protein
MATDALSAINTLRGWSGNGCIRCIKSQTRRDDVLFSFRSKIMEIGHQSLVIGH